MKLISEEILNVEFLTEDTEGKKSHFIEGIFLQGGIKNRNGRFYPVETLAREVAKYDENFITKVAPLANSVTLMVLPSTLTEYHIRS